MSQAVDRAASIQRSTPATAGRAAIRIKYTERVSTATPSVSLGVFLGTEPTGDVTVSASVSPAIVTVSPGSRTYDDNDWDTQQFFTFARRASMSGNATITLNPSGADYGSVANKTVSLSVSNIAMPVERTVLLSTVGAGTWRVPTDVSSIEVELVGGGGVVVMAVAQVVVAGVARRLARFAPGVAGAGEPAALVVPPYPVDPEVVVVAAMEAIGAAVPTVETAPEVVVAGVRVSSILTLTPMAAMEAAGVEGVAAVIGNMPLAVQVAQAALARLPP